jgi:hypothetical protein
MRNVLLGHGTRCGPNYNLPMMAEPRAAIAWDALQQAEKYAGQTPQWSASAGGTIFWPRPALNPKLIGLTGAHLYAKATALAAKGRIEERAAPLSELEKLASADNPGHDRVEEALAIAVLTVRARIALAESKPDGAIGMLREAAAREDRLAYSEPADWFFPVRHLLGALPMQTGLAADAEMVYRDDLSRHQNK